MPKSNNVIVIGNPPYNEGSNAKDSKPIYNRFIETIIDCVNPNKFSMIVPSRWMIGGKGLDSFRERMMNDTHMKSIKHFPGQRDIFESVLIKGGVNYFLWDSEYNGGCDFNGVNRNLNKYDIILQDNEAITILENILSVTTDWISQKCSPRNVFNVNSDFCNWVETGVICYSKGVTKNYINNSDFCDKNGLIGKWKVCTSKGINPNDDGQFEKYNSIFVANPNTVCTDTYLVMNYFDTEIEANNFLIYMKTKLFRFFVSLRVSSQNMSIGSFAWVPDQLDYTREYIDKELYEKYNLTEEEISYIESIFEDNPLCSFSF